MPADRARLEQIAGLLVPTDATYTHLGTGGFASTFRVESQDGDSYALKIIDAAQSGAERTDRELAALQRVSHPNIVGYLDAGIVTSDGVDYRWLKSDLRRRRDPRHYLGRGSPLRPRHRRRPGAAGGGRRGRAVG